MRGWCEGVGRGRQRAGAGVAGARAVLPVTYLFSPAYSGCLSARAFTRALSASAS